MSAGRTIFGGVGSFPMAFPGGFASATAGFAVTPNVASTIRAREDEMDAMCFMGRFLPLVRCGLGTTDTPQRLRAIPGLRRRRPWDGAGSLALRSNGRTAPTAG